MQQLLPGSEPAPPALEKPVATGIERVKPWVETIQGLFTILALLGGAYWFLAQESTKPQIKLDQTVTQRPLVGDETQTLITLDVRATNIGKVKVELSPGTLELLQINPEQDVPKLTFSLQAMTLEPGESDQAIFQTVNIPNTVRTLQVHSEYQVPGARNYWNLLSAVDIGAKPVPKEAASSVH